VLWSNKARRVSVPLIKERNGAVVRASNQDIRVFGREDERAKRRWCGNGLFREIGIVKIPNVRLKKLGKRLR
jgi:hypothetical protein